VTATALARWGGGLLLAAAAAACASSGEPKSAAPQIPTGGDRPSLKAMVGRWEGTYTNNANGRKGTIVLEVFSEGKEAHGDILMIPPDSKIAKPSPAETLRSMPQVYEINYIDAASGKISGTVGPYEDPDTHCQVRSLFEGLLRGETIEGTFQTVCDAGTSSNTGGTWSVARKK
jgi:hypothetical protein